MKDSNKRIQFIADYISAYEEKIKLLNMNGLFDSAKLFELFAIEVGSLYFGQRFNNLNVDTYTYPCVDLISEDKQTYIQVSTAKDIPTKVKTTLENIRDSKRAEINTLTNVKFIVLNNDSVDKVKNLVGKDQIGNVSFTKATDLITTKDILDKAVKELDFQMNLFNLLKKESESISDNSSRLKEAIDNSKNVGLLNIDCKINNEYEINRSELVSKIKEESYKNISIQGRAGSGKSVLCKLLVKDEENIVYGRAERFLEETNINHIWGFNIKQTLDSLNEKPIVFFIDSLEFIADLPAKVDLLQVFFSCVAEYSNVKIITSCRSSDKNAFMKIEDICSFQTYEIPELTAAEQLSIADKYPIIKKMLSMKAYSELLSSPFYINLIVSKVADIDNISNENELRDYIWQHIICLNDNEIRNVVESIVFTRAKGFLLGSMSKDYPTKIIDKLISKDVLVNNGTTVRLKYDIFEDICFEQYFDIEFNNCKGNYNAFFEKIESFGRCIYRRYQIWISNKLLDKNNRDKFLFELVFSKKIPQNWRKQTEIGLVKSRYCGLFFSEYALPLIHSDRLNNFINTTNLYAFEIMNDRLRVLPYIQLRPCGESRQSLIHLVVENKLYESDKISQIDIEKLCTDYSKMQKMSDDTAGEACLILEFIVNKYLIETESKEYYKLDETLNTLLTPIYQMAKNSKEWIKDFWITLSSYYKDDDKGKARLAADVIEDTIKCRHIKLAKYLPNELCALAEMFWTYSAEKKQNHSFGFYETERRDISYQYGLSENAEQYEHDSYRSAAIDSNFFYTLFIENFWMGLNWTIDFINKAVLSFAESNGEELPAYEIIFFDNDTKRNYFGFLNMWLATAEEHKMPIVISDLIYCFKEILRNTIKDDSFANNQIAKFAENVARAIYEKSNNIALLTVIADIGMEFHQKIPGLALDLVTNIDIVYMDLQRFSLLKKNPTLEMLENQIFMTMGVPRSLIPDRYNKKNANQQNLIAYALESQIYNDDDIRIKCYKVLDYLYSIVPNDTENAQFYLFIQRMDLRTAKSVRVDDTTIALIPNITGEAEKLVIKSEMQRQPENKIAILINNCNEKFSKNEFTLKDCLEAIEQLLEASNTCATEVVIDNFLVVLLAFAIKDQEIDKETRARFCQIWIDGIKSYFSNGSFIFEYGLSIVLFMQIDSNVCDKIKNQIKQLIIDLILFRSNHGVVTEIARIAKLYLATDKQKQLAKTVFNTITKLAEDEMNHQKFNAKYYKKHNQENVNFSPNTQPKLFGIDVYLKESKKKKYQSKKNQIIKEYLFENTELDLSNFDMNNHDIDTICYAMNCGLDLDDADFASVVKKFSSAMIDVWKVNQKTHNSHNILGTYALCEVMKFFQKELLKNESLASKALEILFIDVHFSKFTQETVEFYLDIFGMLLAEYFDSHSDKTRRLNCVSIIRSLENKIVEIKEDYVRIELYKSLILSSSRYAGAGDWSKLQSGYSYLDKQFLNDVFSKYGGYHLKEMISTIFKLHLDKLLPEILLSLKDAFKNNFNADIGKQKKETFVEIVRGAKVYILIIITKAFLNCGDPIKQDDDLTKAFEEILEMLVEIRYEEAATILDEFRVH